LDPGHPRDHTARFAGTEVTRGTRAHEETSAHKQRRQNGNDETSLEHDFGSLLRSDLEQLSKMK